MKTFMSVMCAINLFFSFYWLIEGDTAKGVAFSAAAGVCILLVNILDLKDDVKKLKDKVNALD